MESKEIQPKFPSQLRAITVHAPYAYGLCLGLKTEEYRSRALSHRGITLIHSGASKSSDIAFEDFDINPAKAHRKAIIGAVNFTDCIYKNGCFAYVAKDPILFKKPIRPVSGQQVIFWPANKPELITAFNLAWQFLKSKDEQTQHFTHLMNEKKTQHFTAREQDISEFIDFNKPVVIASISTSTNSDGSAGMSVGTKTQKGIFIFSLTVTAEEKEEIRSRRVNSYVEFTIDEFRNLYERRDKTEF